MADALVQVIEVKEQELRGMEKGLENLREQIRLLRAAQGAMTGARATAGNGRLTVVEMATVVMKKSKRVMRSSEMSAAIKEEFGVLVSTHSVGTMLYREAVERGRTFFKDKKIPNAYGLREWQKS